MKQVVQDMRSGETLVVEVPAPRPAPGMALVRTAASVVSPGTERMVAEFASKGLLAKARARPDLARQVLEKARKEGLLATLEAVQGRLHQPVPLGYASAGVIVEASAGLTGFQVGERVACAGGGYAVHAEYALVPKHLLARVPQHVALDSAAFATLGAIGLHAFRLAEPQVAERVAVIGLGLLGQLALGVARAAGCLAFGVDLDPFRVALAQQLGFEAVLRKDAESAARGFTGGIGFDVILICADTQDSDPVELAGELARDRGRVVALGAVGMDLPRRSYYQKELNFIVSRSYGPGRYDPSYEEGGADYPVGYVRWTVARNLQAVVDMIGEGRLLIEPLISHRVPIHRAAEAYALLAGDEPSLGIVLTYAFDRDETTAPTRTLSAPRSRPRAGGRLRIGVLGAGHFGRSVFFPKLKRIADIDLAGVVTASGLSAASVAKRYGLEYASTDEHEVLRDESIDAVAVLTRHHLHAQQIVAALEHGKHVFCEKPPALDRSELESILQALHRSGDKLFVVGYNRRFAPLAVRLKDHFEPVQEPLTLVYRVNAGPLPQGHWLHDPEQGGGRIIGEAGHFVDLISFVLGDLPRRVLARASGQADQATFENVIVQMEFAGGSLASLIYVAHGDRGLPKERIEVFGGGRSGVLDDFRRLETYAHGKRDVKRSWLRQDKGHRAIWEAFVHAVEQGGPPPIPYEELFQTSLATFAAVDSLERGEAVSIQSLNAA